MMSLSVLRKWLCVFFVLGLCILVVVCGLQSLPALVANQHSFTIVDQEAPQVMMDNDDGDASRKYRRCLGRQIFMYDMPKAFNQDIVDSYCQNKTIFPEVCATLANRGMGSKLTSIKETLSEIHTGPGWYNTHQFSLEVLFHERVKQYTCLTKDPYIADMYYVPYYAGLDVARNIFSPDIKLRDELGRQFMAWLTAQEPFVRHQGRDHVMLFGRIAWDFSRFREDEWGVPLLRFPELTNVTKLLIERDPYIDTQIGIPYPTSFHPVSDREMESWQESVSRHPKHILVSFAGAQRIGSKLRNALFDQCSSARASNSTCSVLDCTLINCLEHPDSVTKLFLQSVFCLQPTGDSPTRKALFDCLVAGCIPVFFSTHSAYTQYLWHLPSQADSYSVLFEEQEVIDGLNVINALSEIKPEKIKHMQDVIIRQILPVAVYSTPERDPNSTIKDAFDVILAKIFDRNSSRANNIST